MANVIFQTYYKKEYKFTSCRYSVKKKKKKILPKSMRCASSQLQIHSSSFADPLPTILFQTDLWAPLFPQDYQQHIFQLKIDRFSTLQQWPQCLGFLMELTDNSDWHDNAQTLHYETDAWEHAVSAYGRGKQVKVNAPCLSQFLMFFFSFFFSEIC